MFCSALKIIRQDDQARIALRRGSITAEAAIAFPVFFLIVICIVSIMNVYGSALDRMSSLRDTAEAAAAAADIGEDELWIDLNVPEYFKPYFLPDGLTGVIIPARARVRAWNGRSEAESQGSSDTDDKYVYVTENRSVYHTNAHCTHMELSTRIAAASGVSELRNSDGAKYRPCEKCCRGGHTGVIVYITDDGDRYHSSAECSGLKRTVKLVPASSVCDLPQCSRCAAAGTEHQ